MPVWVSWKTDPIRAQWLCVLIGVNTLCAVICALAPAGDATPALLYIAGGLLLLSAALMACGWSIAGGITGGFGWGVVLATVLLATQRWTALVGIVDVVLGGVAVYHLLVMYDVGIGYDRDRERRQRRGR
jgi:hypothetical protein